MNPASSSEDPENNDELHRIVLCEAFSNMKRGHSNKIIVSTKNSGEAILNRDLFILFSGMLRDLLSSVPQCPSSSFTSSIILPDLSVRTVLRLQDILAQGHCEDITKLEDSRDLLDACRLLGIDIQRIHYERVRGGGGEGSDEVEVDLTKLSEEPVIVRRSVEESKKEGKRIVFVSPVSEHAETETITAAAAAVGDDEAQARPGGGSGGSGGPTLVPDINIKQEVNTETETPVEKSVEKPEEDTVMKPVESEPPTPAEMATPADEQTKAVTESKPALPIFPPGPDGKGITKPPLLYSCEKCGVAQPDLLSLKKHLTTHFLTFFKNKYSKSYQASTNLCLICKSSIGSLQKFLVHVAIVHDKLNEVLKMKGMKVLPPHTLGGNNSPLAGSPAAPSKTPTRWLDVSSSSKNQKPTTQGKAATSPAASTRSNSPSLSPGLSMGPPTPQTPVQKKSPSVPSTPASEKKALDSECNFDLKCQVCQQSSANLHQLESHLCRHFIRELRDSFSHLIDDNKCTLCLNTFKQKHSLIMHIGCKHGKINDILRQKNLPVLPAPVLNHSSTVMQKNLKLVEKAVKKERQDAPASSGETLNEAAVPAAKTETPASSVEEILDKIGLQKYSNLKLTVSKL